MSPDILIEQKYLFNQKVLFEKMLKIVEWDGSMKARKTASFGKPYDYSQMHYLPAEMPKELIAVVNLLEERLNIRFNNCLLNYYQTGNNTMGFHADETAQLSEGTGVAIVSLGSTRTITFRNQQNLNIQMEYKLEPGSLLYMGQDVQQNWHHAIKKQTNVGPRISLTWRSIR
ncbi:Alpha-ketoglutarate-dependent dioxygenase AlkB [Planctomycetales bacterium 10988]|nr:Alpha-ketoglutarate-dependent dioxygenase AlkB [Planctomycetales bacterium 10988]